MSNDARRGVAICTYNRAETLPKIIEAVLDTVPAGTKVIVADDGSTDDTLKVVTTKFIDRVGYYKGPNLGVGANKNRALFALQDRHFICVIEDDLMPIESGWFEIYEKASILTDCHHYCRVQDKEIPEIIPEYSAFCAKNGFTPMFCTSPRGDLTFITSKTIRKVGGFHGSFIGVGHAHGHYSARCKEANLCGGHPLSYMDIKEANQKFIQIGDTTGGRWDKDPEQIKIEVARNAQIRKQLDVRDIYVPLSLP